MYNIQGILKDELVFRACSILKLKILTFEFREIFYPQRKYLDFFFLLRYLV